MRIALGADHAGYLLKQYVLGVLQNTHEIIDVGTHNEEPTDYPVYAEQVALRVAEGKSDLGIILCGSGVGVCITANKIPGIRAVNAHTAQEAALSREHGDCNVLTLPGRILSYIDAEAIIEAFLSTPFAGGRHQRRIGMIADIEARSLHSS